MGFTVVLFTSREVGFDFVFERWQIPVESFGLVLCTLKVMISYTQRLE